jgi:hypothetical protein
MLNHGLDVPSHPALPEGKIEGDIYSVSGAIEGQRGLNSLLCLALTSGNGCCPTLCLPSVTIVNSTRSLSPSLVSPPPSRPFSLTNRHHARHLCPYEQVSKVRLSLLPTKATTDMSTHLPTSVDEMLLMEEEELRGLRESLINMDKLTVKTIDTIRSFDARLQRLETSIRPIHRATQELARQQEGVCLDVFQFCGIDLMNSSPCGRGGVLLTWAERRNQVL